MIAIDKRRSRDGRALEILGFYDPLTEPATVRLETDKINDWIGKGAQPSDAVVRLMRQAEATAKAGADAPAPKRATRAASAKPSPQGCSQGRRTGDRGGPGRGACRGSAGRTEAAVEAAPADETPAEAPRGQRSGGPG